MAQVLLPLWGLRHGSERIISAARSAALAQLLAVGAAFACLVIAFVDNDFSVILVAQNSSNRLPIEYRITATWGNHEGSILLWALVLAGWTFAVAVASRRLDSAILARVLAVLGLVSLGFLGFILLTSNPFTRHFPAPPDGRDLNPLLQDPGMIVHPPLLYMGYVGLAVAFAITVATLWAGRIDAAWVRWCRPWTLAAWCFLTLGIALGSFWAYYELGWGGWWFWDPVENASFIPWLLATALVHSLAVTEYRHGLRAWTALLAIAAFAFALLGTFIVRSGVLSSVHAFATDPARGIFILSLLVVVVGGSLLLFAFRVGRLRQADAELRFSATSRESTLLANNVLLGVAAASVSLGTLYPLVLDALGAGKVSVGPPYFEVIFPALMAPALVLMGTGSVTRWRHTPLMPMVKRLRWAAIGSVVVTAIILLSRESGSWLTGCGLLLASWIALTTAQGAAHQLLKRDTAGGVRLAAPSGGQMGMWLAHLGVAVFVFGVTMVKSYEVERDVRMRPGETVTLGRQELQLLEVREADGPNYKAVIARLQLRIDGKVHAELRPERRLYNASGSPMTEVALDRGLTRDVYVALGQPLGEGAWNVRAQVKPFVNWIWVGCLLMALGGLRSAADLRYRRKRERTASEAMPAWTVAGSP